MADRQISPFEAQLRKNARSDWRALGAWQAAMGAFAVSLTITAALAYLINPAGSSRPLNAVMAVIELVLGAFAVWLFRQSAPSSFRRMFALRWAIVSFPWAAIFLLLAIG